VALNTAHPAQNSISAWAEVAGLLY